MATVPLPALDQALLCYGSETLVLVNDDGQLVHRLGPDVGPLGYTPDGVEGVGHIAESAHPDDLVRVFELLLRTRTTAGHVERTVVRARHVEGHWVSLDIEVREVGDDPRLPGRAVLRIRPVEREAPQKDGPTMKSLADAVPSAVLSATGYDTVVFSNVAAESIFDLPAESLRGDGWRSVIDPEDEPDVATAAGAVLTTSPVEQVTFRVQTGSGTRWLQGRLVPVLDDGDVRTGWVGSFEDVTERRQVEARLAHRATHDPLTSLPNRALLRDRLEQAAARTERDGDLLAVLFVDLDGFKEVNDRLGHAAGDEVLIEVARRMRTVLRPGDTVARVGGDEFVAVCEAVDEETARELTERLEEAIAVPVLVDGGRAQVGASVGVVQSDGTDSEPDELVLRADQAMYRAKRARRDGKPDELAS